MEINKNQTRIEILSIAGGLACDAFQHLARLDEHLDLVPLRARLVRGGLRLLLGGGHLRRAGPNLRSCPLRSNGLPGRRRRDARRTGLPGRHRQL